MDTFKVEQAFNTPLRRWVPGMTGIRAGDVDGVLTANDWVALGYLSADSETVQAPKAPRKA